MAVRILGLDIGKKTIGVALSDEAGITAQPLLLIKRSSLAKDLEDVLRIARENSVGRIVAGLPLNMDGTESSTTGFVLKFVELLRAKSPVPVITWDERLSTAAVERVLIEGDVSRSRRKEVIDKMAASYILQGYLDSGAPGSL
ncbi:MAG: Holliday junction resolvase RuvX [Deltaproteobacteria bacterium]|nr:Holliday junction resolvase RuvX [Deltaproteobacteria bacterium]